MSTPITRPTRAVAAGITALRHETRQDAVKRQTVVELLLDKVYEVAHGLGRFILKKLHNDVALGRH